ncbi:hypothetical protein [Luteimonas sp. R10]|uniref:hypothetical protein n=1 Tax=Luteimonas sp. R10 TaxID=3108176 RepID=UPI0030891E6E|nr:hypothetical protein U3649_07340 [Luteimonas sp. R10]
MNDDAFARPALQSLQPDDDDYAALLALAGGPLVAEFGPDARIEVERLDRLGNWSFLLGRMRAAEGGPLPLEGTRYAERAAQGGMSDVYAVLLKRESGGAWKVVDHAIGPGDVAWLAWPPKHGAPAALFGF